MGREIKALLIAHLPQNLRRNGIVRLTNCLLHVDVGIRRTGVVAVVHGAVAAVFPVSIIVRDTVVLNSCAPGDIFILNRGRINRQRFNRRTRLTVRIRRTVQPAVFGLFTGAADHTDDSAAVIHNGHGGLCIVNFFVVFRERNLIDIYRFHGFLNVHIHSGIDAQTAGINHGRRLRTGIAVFVHQILNHALNDIVDIIALNLGFGLGLLRSKVAGGYIVFAVGKDHFIVNRFVVFFLGNHTLFQHHVQTIELTGAVFVGM